MSLISDTLYIREQSEQFLLDTCVVRQFNGFSTVDGEYAESYTDSAPIPCRVVNKAGRVSSPTSAKDNVQLLTNVSNYKIQIPYSVDINEKDKILFNSVVYDVVFVPIKHALMGAFIISIEKQK